MTDSLRCGTALYGPHGEVAEYRGPANYFGTPGALILRMAGEEVVPASDIFTEWVPVPGVVVVCTRATGRWTTPYESWLTLAAGDTE